MLLTIDLGNTSLKLAIFHEDKKLFSGLYESKHLTFEDDKYENMAEVL